jgi:hypothetical protein
MKSDFGRWREKYDSDIASYIEGAMTHSKSVYDCHTFQQKNRLSREKSFKRIFCGKKSNFKPDYILNFN